MHKKIQQLGKLDSFWIGPILEQFKDVTMPLFVYGPKRYNHNACCVDRPSVADVWTCDFGLMGKMEKWS